MNPDKLPSELTPRERLIEAEHAYRQQKVAEAKTILKWSALLTAAAAFLMLTGCASTPYVKPEMPANGMRFLTHGISMEPTIYPGDWIVAARFPYDQLKVGDWVVYHNHFYADPQTDHRIVAGRPGAWILRGDHNLIDDPGFLTAENYIGKVVWHTGPAVAMTGGAR